MRMLKKQCSASLGSRIEVIIEFVSVVCCRSATPTWREHFRVKYCLCLVLQTEQDDDDDDDLDFIEMHVQSVDIIGQLNVGGAETGSSQRLLSPRENGQRITIKSRSSNN